MSPFYIVMLSVIMLNVVMLSVVILNVVILSVVILSVMAPFFKPCPGHSEVWPSSLSLSSAEEFCHRVKIWAIIINIIITHAD